MEGQTNRFMWTPMALGRLRELRMSGATYQDCAETMSREHGFSLNYNMIDSACKRYGLTNLLEVDGRAKRYVPMTLPMDDYAICSDVHAPFHSEAWVNRFLLVSQRFGVKKCIVVGDLLDCNFASKWYCDDGKDLDAEVDLARPVFEGLDYFDHVYWGRGNHERRIGLMTDGLVQMKHLGRLFGGAVWDKITYSPYDRFWIEKEWVLVHPKSYRQTIVSVARDIAGKYLANVINTHGHFVGMGYDRSGRYLCVDLGGLFEPSKIDYLGMDTTTHPAWKNGFGILKDGHFWHFTDATDWRHWIQEDA